MFNTSSMMIVSSWWAGYGSPCIIGGVVSQAKPFEAPNKVDVLVDGDCTCPTMMLYWRISSGAPRVVLSIIAK